ncbi:MAG: hypothetical protein EBR32_02155 [Bacteroidetes bacterium]|nr:hypothetical protein [Bacteroidota bacterium]
MALVCLFVLTVSQIFSQDLVNNRTESIVTIAPLSGEISLDGRLSESVWKELSPFPMTQLVPIHQGEMSEQTRIYMTYDSKFVYIAAENLTRDASSIISNTLRRDDYEANDDIIGVVFDSFNDNDNGLTFFTNPEGVRVDFAISNDGNFGSGVDAFNGSWNTYWDVETTRDANGWYAEMRIPFSSLGFQVIDDVTQMGVIVYRWIASLNERHVFPDIPPNWSMSYLKPSQSQTIEFKALEQSKPLYITPYSLSGFQDIFELNEDEDAYVSNAEWKQDFGLDLKYNLSSDLTLDITANTDFAQVEADEQQLNLTRFSIDFPEKRQFFQQRSGLFDFSFGHTKLFYSRRIGLSEGNPIPIIGGARLTGRIGALDVGVLNIQTQSFEGVEAENFGVIRLKKQILNPQSYIGSIYTHRFGFDGAQNVVMGFDVDYNIKDENFIQFKLAQTIDNTEDYNQDFLSGTGVISRLTIDRRTNLGWFYRLMFNYTGEGFNPGIGFVRTTNTADYYGSLGYGWLAPEASTVKQHQIQLRNYSIQSYDGFVLRSRYINLEWSTQFKLAGNISSEFVYRQEHLLDDEDFDLLSRIYIPVDDYGFFEWGLSYRSPEQYMIRGNISSTLAQIYDGTIRELSIEPKLRVNVHLDFSLNYRVSHLEFPQIIGRELNSFTVHQSSFKAAYAMNRKFSANAFIQTSNVSEKLGANIRLRYNFREGQDFWLVVNQNGIRPWDERNVDNLRLPSYDQRSILIKYTHTFLFD